MGLYEKHVLPRMIDLVMRNRVVDRERSRILGDVEGEVLEIGFGSGLNLPHYGRGVRRVVGVDPSGTGRNLAQGRIETVPFEVEFIGIEGELLPVEEGRFDAAVSTFTLCTIPGVERALDNVRRALKPGGRFYFLEHGWAAEERVQRWQRRLEPVQKKIAGGCHLTRVPDQLIEQAGFSVEGVERYYVKGPRPLSFLYRGVAVRAT